MSKHPTFNEGDVVWPTDKALEAGMESDLYLVLEPLRGPKMRAMRYPIRAGGGPREVRVMRKHFKMYCSAEERVALAVMG